MTISDAVVRSAFDSLPGQAAILDPTGRILATNRAWREFGTTNGGEPDHVGENYLAVCDASDDEKAARTAAALRRLVDGEREEVSVEYPCHAPDRDRWFVMRAEVFDHDGEQYLLVVHFDITDRKLAELEVREKNDRLETVANVLSHDIRNPLTVAMGRVEMMESEHADPLVESLERIDAIVGDALLLARRDRVEETKAVDLTASAERAWRQVDTGAIDLTFGESVRFEADPDLLGHVFENLFRNSVEHGATTVRVGALENGFYVEDDGPGVPPAERESVFDARYSTGEGGTGLGLTIVERVVDAHGWSIRVAGEEVDTGELTGARFEVRF
ncbi:PAS domain-containing sensor histidine kinase [Halorussus rarus]|uniref:PAS domain-containing sensor histidine kinase n=1 Tax=Halorussus TaxID=1070314 RepID=UPI000E21486C|nr:PAS domain-containing sensor histidine kinase [Halorussus rarus]NHN58141.1 PAS domain-containing sensor histidine kinase [Halorussus sp. JP-T4]